ncbi:hypothetical protein PIB30_003550 [Stylosanthes scabra]|uniref:Uncharacterized protein n=1 Tax=Stylosanthes scabra TaxID=79078 RepID=A0ABU6X1A2_9FABA|nr:hypothetical protein [Stylosanthes scabra]
MEEPLGSSLPSKSEGISLESSAQWPPCLKPPPSPYSVDSRLLSSMSSNRRIKEVWHLSDLQAPTDAVGFTKFWRWWNSVVDNLKRQPHWRRRASSAATILWGLWCERNARIFEQTTSTSESVITSAQSLITEYHLHHPP